MSKYWRFDRIRRTPARSPRAVLKSARAQSITRAMAASIVLLRQAVNASADAVAPGNEATAPAGSASVAKFRPPDAAERRLFRLKRAIRQGAYRVDPQRVARKLLKRS